MIERSPPISAAPSGGTTRALRPSGVSEPPDDPTMIAEPVATIEAITQLIAASSCGE